MVHVYAYSNANTHGQFVTSHETDQLIDHTRNQVAALLGAEGPHTISFGANMTSLNFVLANAISRSLQPGDEILITQLDHEANRGPWLQQRRHGIVVREVLLEEDGSLDYADLEKKISEKTRVIAIGLASNIFGTVNEIGRQVSQRRTTEAQLESASEVSAAAAIIRATLEPEADVVEAPAEATVRFRTVRTESELGGLLRRLIESKIHVTQFREVQTDLEEAFMSFARPQENGNSPKPSADGVTSHA